MPFVDINDVRLSDYRIELTKRLGGERYVLLDGKDSVISRMTIDQDIDSPTIDFSFDTLRTREELVDNGDILDIYGPKITNEGSISIEKLWTCYIMQYDDDFWSRDNIVARNIGHWATTSSFYLKMEQAETAKMFVQRTAAAYGIEVEHLADTEYILQPYMFNKSTLYNAWLNVYSRTGVEEGRTFLIHFALDRLRIDELDTADDVVKPWYEVTEPAANVIEPSRSRSIIDKDFTNIVRGGKFVQRNAADDIPGLSDDTEFDDIIEVNQESADRYGEFQRDIDVQHLGTREERVKYLKETVAKSGTPIEKVKFESFAHNGIKPSDRIYIVSPQIRANGEYFIQNLRTTIAPGYYRDRIEANKLRNIPFEIYSIQDYGPDYAFQGEVS